MDQKIPKSERMYSNKAFFEGKLLNFKEMQNLHKKILQKMRDML